MIRTATFYSVVCDDCGTPTSVSSQSGATSADPDRAIPLGSNALDGDALVRSLEALVAGLRGLR